LVAATQNFAAATKRFVDRNKHFVAVTKYFCYPYIKNDFVGITIPFFHELPISVKHFYTDAKSILISMKADSTLSISEFVRDEVYLILFKEITLKISGKAKR